MCICGGASVSAPSARVSSEQAVRWHLKSVKWWGSWKKNVKTCLWASWGKVADAVWLSTGCSANSVFISGNTAQPKYKSWLLISPVQLRITGAAAAGWPSCRWCRVLYPTSSVAWVPPAHHGDPVTLQQLFAVFWQLQAEAESPSSFRVLVLI